MRGPLAKATILSRLRESPGYVSGERLSAEIGISRPGVWKHIENLRAEGYRIDALPRVGYRLLSSPDLLVPAEILPRLRTKLIGRRILHFDSVASTNDAAKELAMKGAAEGTVVVAETQGAGRGRLGRPWVSPRGGIYFSVVLRPKLPPTEVAKVTLTMAVSIAAAIRQTTGVAVTIKWPNDILFGERKIVGILTEMAAEADSVGFAVVGIGMNANTQPADYPVAMRSGLTTLAAELEGPVDRVALFAACLEEIDRDWARLAEGGLDDVFDDWRSMSSTLATRVRVSTVAGAFEGVAKGIDTNGALVVEDDGGEVRTFASGEVEHLRPA